MNNTTFLLEKHAKNKYHLVEVNKYQEFIWSISDRWIYPGNKVKRARTNLWRFCNWLCIIPQQFGCIHNNIYQCHPVRSLEQNYGLVRLICKTGHNVITHYNYSVFVMAEQSDKHTTEWLFQCVWQVVARWWVRFLSTLVQLPIILSDTNLQTKCMYYWTVHVTRNTTCVHN